MAFKIILAHSSALINLLSSKGLSPWDSPLLFSAALRILDVVKPGHTHITCTPLSINSVRMASSQPCKANFEAEYPLRPGKPLYPAMEDTPTIIPLRSIKELSAKCVQYTAPKKLISITFLITSTEASFNSARMEIPALLIKISIPPKTFTVDSIKRRQSFSLLTSVTVVCKGNDAKSVRKLYSLSLFRPHVATLAPF